MYCIFELIGHQRYQQTALPVYSPSNVLVKTLVSPSNAHANTCILCIYELDFLYLFFLSDQYIIMDLVYYN